MLIWVLNVKQVNISLFLLHPMIFLRFQWYIRFVKKKKKRDLLRCQTCSYILWPIKTATLKVYLQHLLLLQVSLVTGIDKILDCRMSSVMTGESTSTKLESKQYLVKWKGLSYLHCTWYFITFYSFLWILQSCSLLFYHYIC